MQHDDERDVRPAPASPGDAGGAEAPADGQNRPGEDQPAGRMVPRGVPQGESQLGMAPEPAVPAARSAEAVTGPYVLIRGIMLDAPSVPIDANALADVRAHFNPSGLDDVERLKHLAAAFISECTRIAARARSSSREFAIARTEMQTAAMWAVAGATKR